MLWNHEEMPGFGHSDTGRESENVFSWNEGWHSIEDFEVPEDVLGLLSPDLVVSGYLYRKNESGEQYQFIVTRLGSPDTFTMTVTKKPGQAPVPEERSSM